jgi:predicted SnoaL-like aldol condensation-catalyzing enzyme
MGIGATIAGTPRIVWLVHNETSNNKDLITAFFRDIRNGADLGAAERYLAPRVVAHQVCSEEPIDVERTPENYAEHVAEMIDACENFSITLDALIADESLVYTRWTQRGIYTLRDDDDEETRQPVTEFASAVYRVDTGKIVEYWVQIDRFGTLRQLKQI